MSATARRRTDCRGCHAAGLELALKLAPTPSGDQYIPSSRANELQPLYPMDVFLCPSCGLVQFADTVAPEILYGEYLYETSISLGLVDHFHQYARDVVAATNPSPGSLVVDIGSNDGSLLRAFADLGLTVLGIDPAAHIAERATARGIPTLAGFVSEELALQIRTEHGAASVVTANNVIANIDDLDEVARALRALLAPDGVFVMESFYIGDVIRNMVFEAFFHEHLCAFAVQPLDTFFALHGFELIDVSRIATKGGSLRYTAQLAGGPRARSESVAALLEEEKREGLADLARYRAFAADIDAIKHEVVTVLGRLEREGRTIAGYGASATTTPLLYHFEIGRFIDRIFDDNPLRQGLLSPGLHLPVVSPEEIYHRLPDAIVVLAWRYSTPIIQAHQRYLDTGGTFIIPLPTPQTITGARPKERDRDGRGRGVGARRI